MSQATNLKPARRKRKHREPEWELSVDRKLSWVGPVKVQSSDGEVFQITFCEGPVLPQPMLELLSQAHASGTPVRAHFWDGATFEGVIVSFGPTVFGIEGPAGPTFWARRRAVAVLEFAAPQ